MTIIFDFLFFFCGWIVGQLLFNGYEAHVALLKRLTKLVVMTLIFAAVHVGLGRQYFYGLLVLMTLGMTVLHGYWFQYRHGIHWRTAEPREQYLRLIDK